VRMADELENVGKVLSILRAPKEGATAKDLANQLGQVFWEHLHPSGREALFGSVARAHPAQADKFAERIAAGKVVTAEEFDAQFPSRVRYVKSGITGVKKQVKNTLGPELMKAPPEVRDPVIRIAYRIKTEFPEFDLAHIEIVSPQELMRWDPKADAGTEAITVGTYNDSPAILLSSDYFGPDQAAVYARMRAAAKAQGSAVPPAVNLTPSGTIYHELAHALFERISTSSPAAGRRASTRANVVRFGALNDLFDALPDSPGGRALSQYGANSPAELQAELFDAAMNPETDMARYPAVGPAPTSPDFHDPDMPVGSWGLSGPQTAQEAVDELRRIMQETGMWVPPTSGPTATWTQEMTDGLLARAERGRAAQVDWSRVPPPAGFVVATGDAFHSAAASAAAVVKSNGRKVGETLFVYPKAEYRKMRTFLSSDGKTGYAIKSDGDLVSVFNVGEKGRIEAIIGELPGQGATKLDAFDESGRLPELYAKAGFTETGRVPFDPAQAPPGWTGGRPDVVYMQHPSHPAAVVDPNPEVERAYQYFTKWARAVIGNESLGKNSATLGDVLRGMPTEAAVPYNKTHAMLYDTVSDRMRQLENDTYRMQYFARDRTLLERSINHPFFGLYPASYMWFKIMPELVRFIAKEPFGLQTGAMAYTLADVEKAIAIQREYDPSFDKMIEDVGHSSVIWMLGYLLPATPWDVPAAAPTWLRDLSQQGLESAARAEKGLPAKDINYWSPVNRVADYISPLRSADQLNRVVKELGNSISGSKPEQRAGGGSRAFPFVGPFPNEQASPVQQLAAPLGDAMDELTKALSQIGAQPAG
jgi:hypothetical protein